MTVRVEVDPEGDGEDCGAPRIGNVIFQDAYMALVAVAPFVTAAVAKGCRRVTVTVSVFED